MKVLNLTQHLATVEQLADGVVEIPEELKARLVEELTFTSLPTQQEIELRVNAIEDIVFKFLGVDTEYFQYRDIRELGYSFMVGGAPYLMRQLVDTLEYSGDVYFSYTDRVSVESIAADGTVTKTSVFKHLGWVRA